MIDTKSAKARFLSHAFQGQLVAFSRQEIQNDTLENLHRKQKNYSPVSESEYLINTPSNWNWSRLGYVTSNHGQIIPNEDFCYIDVGTLDNVHQRLSETENIVSSKDAPSRARKVVQDGDVLYSTVRPYLHNICVVDRQFSRMPIASTAFCVMQPDNTVLLNKFLFYWLLTPEFDKFSNGDPSKGTLYPAIGEKDLLHGVIPIPSLAEQALIIERIESVFSVLDTIDNLQSQYFYNQAILKEKLIDAAIRGKLTEQLPEDGNAEELYQQIQEEKKALIKAGKMKKEKPLSEIKEEEMPFIIPNNWKWIPLGRLICIESGKGLTASEMKPGKIPVYGGNGITGYNNCGFVQKGTIVIGRVGYYCGSVHITTQESWVTDNAFITTYPENCVDKRFLAHVLRYLKLGQNNNGSAQPVVSGKKIYPLPFPLPPIAEQKRIAAKLDELLNKIEMEKINV